MDSLPKDPFMLVSYINQQLRDNDNSLDTQNPAPRCPVILLLDTSSSMEGAPIDEHNGRLRFKEFFR